MKKALAFLLALTLLTALLCGCGTTTATTEKTLTVQVTRNPETIDPALSSEIDGANLILCAFDCLLRFDENSKLVASMASEWNCSDDGLVWTFKLRDGLKWSDGSKLTASDFVYSWKRLADPAAAAPYAETMLKMVKGFDEVTATGNLDLLAVEAPDDTTFVVTLSHPCPYFDVLTASPSLCAVNQRTVEANGDSWATMAETYVCNGPFYIKEWVPNSYILFAKNTNYYDADRVKLDTIKYLLIDDTNAAYAAYQTGEAQMIHAVPAAEVAALSSGSDFHVEPILGTYYVSLNTKVAPFDNPTVRKALSLAIDRKYLTETLMDNTYLPASSFIGPGFSDWDGSQFMDNANGGKPYIDVNDFEGNLAKAKELLAEAGYPNGEGFPDITYTTDTAEYHPIVAQYLQKAWKELGIEVKIETIEWSSFLPKRRAGDYQACRHGWVCDYNDVSNLLTILISTDGNNDGKFSNAEYDELSVKADSETDPQTRFSYLHRMEDIIMEETACIPLAYYSDFWLESEKIVGAWHSPYGYWNYQFADIAE